MDLSNMNWMDVKYYSGIKKTEALTHATTWMNYTVKAGGHKKHILYDFVYTKCL